MTRPDDVTPERLEAILAGAEPRDDEERALAALVAQTRALEPGAPGALRERVMARAAGEGGAEPSPAAARRRSLLAWLRTADRRRRLLVAAPVVAGLAALAIAIPVLDGGGGPEAGPRAGDDVAAQAAREAAPGDDLAAPERASGGAAAPPVPPGATAAVPQTARAQQVASWTRVRVDGVEDLSRASDRAMATVRRLGGFTATSDYSVPDGDTGTNRLVFRVPVGRAEEAIAAFGRLGTVVGQRADIVDVTARLDAGARAIERLTRRVDDLRARLAADPGDAGLRAQLARAEAQLRRAEDRHRATTDRATLATLHLTLTTEAPPPPPAEEGRFAGPIGSAGDRLADAVAWLLGALVLVGPFAAVALAGAWGAARLRRRSARRLMGSA